ncbi:MAG: alpha/beta hydrolase [Vallitaleaceae bacterium]|nr:alpha/beta hydrolase [Vallitaleaceae bacterium]
MEKTSRERVLLIHGFHKTYKDMTPLRRYLLEKGYQVSRINLPLTFTTIEEATILFNEIAMKKVPRLKPGEKVHLVGHSTGGLIIRHFLATSDFLPYVGRCVLIATPNQGYELAEKAAMISKTYISIYKTMDSLLPENVQQLKMIDDEVEIGAIAGTKPLPVVSNFIEGVNDGRISVDAVKYEGMKDFVMLPYHHMEIHKREETAELVDRFIRTGSFEVEADI